VIYFCSQKNRRALVLQHSVLNGIDYLEVAGAPGCGTQLMVTLLRDARNLTLTPAQVAISGGGAVEVKSVTPGTDAAPFVVTIQLKQTGDFSTYTLSLIADASTTDPPPNFDPQLSSVEFSFKAGCVTPGDCVPDNCCPPPVHAAPDINYLAKDYNGFRQIMLDRMAVTAPGFTEMHAADMGIALVETLAYAADHLSYEQDAVGTEAYIGTSRSRISLRRHAKLVDYVIGEGCNARAWISVTVGKSGATPVSLAKGALFYVRFVGLPSVISPTNPRDTVAFDLITNNPQPVFASMETATLWEEHNNIDFYTWSDTNCCLAPGATQATLVNNLNHLGVGSVLVFEEVLGPLTGVPEDADPTHRWAVRLTGVQTQDYLGNPLADPLKGQPITRVTWSQEDALPFPLCISSTSSNDPPKQISGVSVAHGNVVPADHGVWQDSEPLLIVPNAHPAPSASSSCTCGGEGAVSAPLPRYYPQLAKSPLTFKVPYADTQPASAFLCPNLTTSLSAPQICVVDDAANKWQVETDLLLSTDSDRAFVVEIERDGTAFLRFGDNQYGMAAESGTEFFATYRIGNGAVGNVGRDTLVHIITNENILAVRNPLAAAGGTDPEDMEHIRQYAPFAFQSQLRCVTESDFGDMAITDPAIQAARGTLRWTGSWYTAFVSIEPAATETPALIGNTLRRMNMLRMMGTDVAVEGAIIVGLRIEFNICVAADHFQGDVYETLMTIFVSGNQCNGQAGLLNAKNFTFGQTIYASPLIAAAQAVEGVISATLTVLERMDNPSINSAAQGYLAMGRLEIARCDNDPNHLDHGLFLLHLYGGK
jgi:hypothetical protein